MRKSIFMLAAFLACGFIIAACSSEKKSTRSDSITVEVTPSSIGEITVSSPTRTLTAVVRVNGVVQSSPTVSWVVNPSSFGVCDPNQGETTLFTADITQTGQGSIVASYNGTASSPVQFSINEAPAVIVDSIMITPSATQNITSTDTITFTATAMAGTTTVTGVTLDWTVTGGSVSPSQSQSGASVVFTPSGAGNATVNAGYGDVNSSIVNVVIGSTGVAHLTFVLDGFTVEGGLNDIYGWGGAPANAYTVPVVWPREIGHDGTVRGIFSMTWNSGWDGPTLVRQNALDASLFTELVFYAKVPSGTGDIVVRALGSDAGASTSFEERGFSLTTTWQKCTIPIPADKSAVIGVICFVLASDRYVAQGKVVPSLPYTFYIDDVHYE